MYSPPLGVVFGSMIKSRLVGGVPRVFRVCRTWSTISSRGGASLTRVTSTEKLGSHDTYREPGHGQSHGLTYSERDRRAPLTSSPDVLQGKYFTCRSRQQAPRSATNTSAAPTTARASMREHRTITTDTASGSFSRVPLCQSD